MDTAVSMMILLDVSMLNGDDPDPETGWLVRRLIIQVACLTLTGIQVRLLESNHRVHKLPSRMLKTFLLGVQDIKLKLFSLSFSLLGRRSTKLS